MESLNYSFKTHTSAGSSNISDSFHYQDNLFVVVEGLGGNHLGEIAKEKAYQVIFQSFFQYLSKDNSPHDALTLALQKANHEILLERKKIGQKMAASVAAIYIQGRIMYFTHLGDTRIYCRQEGELSQLTRDHTVKEDESFDETLSSDPRYLNALTEGLGFYPDPEINVKKFALRDKDLILVATEGLTKNVSDREILRVTSKSRNLKKLSSELIKTAHRSGNATNMTLGFIRFEGLAKDQKKKAALFSAMGLLLILIIGLMLVYYEGSEYQAEDAGQKEEIVVVEEELPIKIKEPKIKIPAVKPPEPETLPEPPVTTPTKEIKQKTQVIDQAFDPASEIKDTLKRWARAWGHTAGENGEIDNYLDFYSDNFSSRGFDKTGWAEDKIKKNRKKSWIEVEISNIKISDQPDKATILVRFDQNYRSSNFSTRSKKKVVLKKEGKDWKIFKE